MLLSEICLLEEEVCEQIFCGALVIFWSYSRGVVVTLVAGAKQRKYH